MAEPIPMPTLDVGAEVRRQMIIGIAAAGPHIAKTTLELARILGSPRRGAAVREEFWQQNAAAVQRSVVASYRATVHHGRYGATPANYRDEDTGKNRRYTNGVLLKALEADENYVASSDGLALFDQTFLDSQARQWYRLNFGTAPHGREQATYGVTFGRGVRFAELTLPGRPSGPMIIPAGFFTANGEFYPKSADYRGAKHRYVKHIKERQISGGIEARGFLDAGVRRLALNLSGESGRRSTSLLGLYNRLWRNGVAETRPPARITAGLTTVTMTLTYGGNDDVAA